MSQAARNPQNEDLQSAEVRLRLVSRGRIKSLAGFHKNLSIPERCDEQSDTFVKEIGNENLENESEKVFQNLRSAFAFKRKEMSVNRETGSCVISCPDFETSLTIEIDPEDFKRYQILCEVGSLRDSSTLGDDRLSSAFPAGFTELRISPKNKVNIPDLIDSIEEKEIAGARLSYPSSADWCELSMQDVSCCLRMTPHSLSLVSTGAVSAKQLWNSFQSISALIQ